MTALTLTAAFARAVLQLFQRATKRFDFPFIGILLALCQLEGFQDFFHFLEALAKHFNDPIHFFDGSLYGGRLCRLTIRIALPFLAFLARV